MQGEMLKYYSRNQFFLSMLGIWPYQSRMRKILSLFLVLAIQFSGLITQVPFLCNTWGDMSLTVEVTINMILIIGATIKYLNIFINNKKIKCLLEMMEEHWQLFHNKCELHILNYYGNIGQIITKYYSAYINMFVVFFFLIPLKPKILDVIMPLNESRPTIYILVGEWGVDQDEYYYPILFHILICVILSTRFMVNCDTMYIVSVLHSCSLFSSIGTRLENIHNEIKHVKDKKMSQRYLQLMTDHDSENYREIIACLKKHQLAIEFVDMIESSFKTVTFIILSMNVMVLSLIGLLVLNKLGQAQEMLRFGFIAIGAITHLMSMCMPGQVLLEKSSEIFDKAYNTPWYMFSSKATKLLSILLHRSLVPCTLSAEDMFIMSVETFSTVMQTAMSYFTTFLSVG